MLKVVTIQVWTLFLLTGAGVVLTQYKSCSENSSIKRVLCNGKPTNCVLKRGHNATLQVDFIPKVSSPSLKTLVYGIISDVKVPFHGVDPNGCDRMSPSCPIKPGHSYSLKASIPVKRMYPAIPLVVLWKDQDPSGKDVLCFATKVRIV